MEIVRVRIWRAGGLVAERFLAERLEGRVGLNAGLVAGDGKNPEHQAANSERPKLMKCYSAAVKQQKTKHHASIKIKSKIGRCDISDRLWCFFLVFFFFLN